MRQNYNNINIETLKEIVLQSDSLVEVTKKLGFGLHLVNSRRHIERLIKRKNISIEHFSTVKRVREFTVRYNKDKLIELVKKSKTLKEILLELDILPIESNYKTLKKYLRRYDIDYSHIIKGTERTSIVRADYDENNLRKIITESSTYSEVLIKLGLVTRGSNFKTLHKYINKYNIDVLHFNANAVGTQKLHNFIKIPLDKILIENSKYLSTNTLKKRLYKEGLKEKKCELCGQDENWHGEHMSLIIDHINGINNDNRFENLQIVCPNCNATLPTFSGKKYEKEK